MLTQFLAYIGRGENIQLVDGGMQKRVCTYVGDDMDALVAIIANENGVTHGKIHHIGNPVNNYSIRELAAMMLAMAGQYPEYRENAKRVKLVNTTAAGYYGAGDREVQNCVLKIENIMQQLAWKLTFSLGDALHKILDAYKDKISEAANLDS